MFILSYICRGLEFWSVNHTSLYEQSELKYFKIIKFVGDISTHWPRDLWGTNVYKAIELWW